MGRERNGLVKDSRVDVSQPFFFLLTNIWSVYIIYYIICTGGVCYE